MSSTLTDDLEAILSQQRELLRLLRHVWYGSWSASLSERENLRDRMKVERVIATIALGTGQAIHPDDINKPSVPLLVRWTGDERTRASLRRQIGAPAEHDRVTNSEASVYGHLHSARSAEVSETAGQRPPATFHAHMFVTMSTLGSGGKGFRDVATWHMARHCSLGVGVGLPACVS